MELKPGDTIWIPCEVKPGPFSNERIARVESMEGSKIVFVEERFLRESIREGRTQLRARVVSVEPDFFLAELPGHSIESRTFRGERANLDLVPA